MMFRSRSAMILATTLLVLSHHSCARAQEDTAYDITVNKPTGSTQIFVGQQFEISGEIDWPFVKPDINFVTIIVQKPGELPSYERGGAGDPPVTGHGLSNLTFKVTDAVSGYSGQVNITI